MATNLRTGLRQSIKSSLETGLVGSNIFGTSTLDLRFAQQKSLGPRVTFTRASSATFVGSDGLIKTAVTNLLLQSEDLATTWTATRASVSINQIAAPNGTTTADKIIEDSTASATHFVQQSASVTSGTTYTFSVYAKAAERSFMALALNGQFSAVVSAIFSLSDGSVGTTVGSPTTSAVFVGNGWWRVSISQAATSTGSTAPIVRVSSSSTTSSYTGDGISGFYIWGAQLEQSSTVGEYIPTTSTINSAPRFDHNPTTGESLGLLVEEARTNSLLQSNQFDTTWTNTNSSETAAAGIAPDGTNTAWELKDTSDVTSTPHLATQLLSWTAGVTYTVSCWMKAGTLNEGGISFPGSAFTTAIVCRFNLTTGALINASAGITASSVVFPNGWVRIIATATATTTAAAAGISIRTANGGNSYIGTGTGTILIWGAQIEAGAFPTSYIPTGASGVITPGYASPAVTRAADVASITGSNFSSFYNQTEGTVFADVNSAPVNTIVQLAVDISDAGGSDRMFIRRTGSGSLVFAVVDGGVTQADVGAGSVISGGARFAMAAAYRLNSINLASNGQIGIEDTSATIPTPDRMFIAQTFASTQQVNGTIRRLTYWPTRLANTTLQQITRS